MPADSFEPYVRIFKALADETRLEIAAILAVKGELCVCEIAEVMDQPDAKISRHLAIMRNADLVQHRREGTWMHYRLTQGEQIIQCLSQCLSNHVAKSTHIRNTLENFSLKTCGPNS